MQPLVCSSLLWRFVSGGCWRGSCPAGAPSPTVSGPENQRGRQSVSARSAIPANAPIRPGGSVVVTLGSRWRPRCPVEFALRRAHGREAASATSGFCWVPISERRICYTRLLRRYNSNGLLATAYFSHFVATVEKRNAFATNLLQSTGTPCDLDSDCADGFTEVQLT